MAKGDDARTRNLIKYGENRGRDIVNNTRTGVLEPQYGQIRDSYVNSIGEGNQERDKILQNYGEFAKTGGYSDQNIQDIRNRSTNPLKSVYAGANREVDRSRSLQGGYSPGYGVLKARMAREQGQAMSDANTNINAGVAQMVNQGKLAGNAGLLSTYGTASGQTNMYGNQMLNASGQIQNQDKLEVDRLLGLIGQQNQLNQAPGKFQSAMGNIGSVFDVAGKIGRTAGGF